MRVPGRAVVADRIRLRTRDYTVGYGRPPKATQFKKGQSGNPKGRSKGSRSIGATLQAIIGQKIAVTEHGTTRRIPALEVMLRRLTNDAMRGDVGALKLLLSLIERYAQSPQTEHRIADLLTEDLKILARYQQSPGSLVVDPPLKSKKKGRAHGI
jgi:hypothetical protein